MLTYESDEQANVITTATAESKTWNVSDDKTVETVGFSRTNEAKHWRSLWHGTILDIICETDLDRLCRSQTLLYLKIWLSGWWGLA